MRNHGLNCYVCGADKCFGVNTVLDLHVLVSEVSFPEHLAVVLGWGSDYLQLLQAGKKLIEGIPSALRMGPLVQATKELIECQPLKRRSIGAPQKVPDVSERAIR